MTDFRRPIASRPGVAGGTGFASAYDRSSHERFPVSKPGVFASSSSSLFKPSMLSSSSTPSGSRSSMVAPSSSFKPVAPSEDSRPRPSAIDTSSQAKKETAEESATEQEQEQEHDQNEAPLGADESFDAGDDEGRGRQSGEPLDIESTIDRLDADISRYEKLLELVRARPGSPQHGDLEERPESPLPPEQEEQIKEPSEADEPAPEEESDSDDSTAADFDSDISEDADPVKPLFETIYANNRKQSARYAGKLKARESTILPADLVSLGLGVFKNVEPEQMQVFLAVAARHEEIRDELAMIIFQRKTADLEHRDELRAEFERTLDTWRRKTAKVEERIRREKFGPGIAGESPALKGGSSSSTRSSRRNPGFTSDVIRSEAEFEELLSQLQAREALEGQEGDSHRWARDVPMELDYEQKWQRKFLDRNQMVLDPVEELRKRALQVVWTEEETQIFKQKLGYYGKDFPRIAKFLPSKTWNDCVAFFYRNKYRMQLKQIARRSAAGYWYGRRGGRMGGMPPSREMEMEMELASMVSSRGGYRGRGGPGRPSGRPGQRSRRQSDHEDEEEGNAEGEAAQQQQDAVATNNEDTMDTSHEDEEVNEGGDTEPDAEADPKREDDDRKKDEGGKKAGGRRPASSFWSPEEKQAFIDSLAKHGRNWEQISIDLGTKTSTQCKSFFHNYRVSSPSTSACDVEPR